MIDNFIQAFKKYILKLIRIKYLYFFYLHFIGQRLIIDTDENNQQITRLHINHMHI